MKDNIYLQNGAERKQIEGLAFDIDGTLIDENSPQVSPAIINRIITTLRLNQPVIIATGRGLGSVEEIILPNLLSKIKDSERVSLFSNFFVVIQNGSKIYRTEINDSGDFNFVLEQEKTLENAEEIFDTIKDKYSDQLVLTGEGFISKAKSTSVVLSFKDGANLHIPSTAELSRLLYTRLPQNNFLV
jgi:HAD superfamily hydrolase (TIGR01484 family)